VLKCDVAKFYPSLDHEVLMHKLEQVIPCDGALELCFKIVNSHRTPDQPRPCGLPIGNLTSQIWGNIYLDEMDHLITDQLDHGAYLRYTDDFLLFGDDKPALWELRDRIVAHLATIHLKLAEPKSRLMATKEGVPFCGFKFLPGLQPRILGATKRRFERRRDRILHDGTPLDEVTTSIFSWYQFSKEANSEGLRQAYQHWPRKPSERRPQKRRK
jgi:hypothetical protein